MSKVSKATTDHKKIRQWAEERNAKPSAVKSTHTEGETGIIRLDLPGFAGEGSLEEISWDEFFKKFEDTKLAFVYEDKTSDGQKSNFNKLVKRESIE